MLVALSLHPWGCLSHTRAGHLGYAVQAIENSKYITPHQCSIFRKQWGSSSEGARIWGAPPPIKIFIFFSFQNSAFWYTNSEVLFALKCRERYVIMVFLAIDSDAVTDMKTSSFHQSRKLIPVQSVIRMGFTATVGMCYRPRIILYELQWKRKLHCRATIGPWSWCAADLK